MDKLKSLWTFATTHSHLVTIGLIGVLLLWSVVATRSCAARPTNDDVAAKEAVWASQKVELENTVEQLSRDKRYAVRRCEQLCEAAKRAKVMKETDACDCE